MSERVGATPSARARDWRRRALAAICDVIEPWEHGTVVRATRYPGYYDFNAVQVQQEPEMGVDELIAFADRALSGLAHRRVDFEVYDAGAARRAEFEARGWKTLCLLRLRHEGDRPASGEPEIAVEQVPYDAVDELRAAWHEEDFPGVDASEHFGEAREVSEARNVVVLAFRRDRVPIAYAEIERDGDGAEVTSVYVRAEDRGQGLGTAVTRAAMAAAPPVRDLWIGADDEDRPKRLYMRLGFRPVWRSMEFLRLPGTQA